MEITLKVLSVGGIQASDGSLIPRSAMESYLASDEFKNDLKGRRILGTLTHRSRNIDTISTNTLNTGVLKKTVGKDDSIITVGLNTPPVYYIHDLFIGKDEWLYAKATLFSEDGLDHEAIEGLRRLKGLLNQGVLLGCSAVILAYWENTSRKFDVAKKIVKIKGVDITVNPSWSDAKICEIVDDNGDIVNKDETVRMFSDTKEELNDEMKVKAFSDLSVFGDFPKSSKIDNMFTTLKAKEFSVSNASISTEEGSVEEKEFSTANLKERVRFAKYSPRLRMRRLWIDYKSLVKQMGGVEKIDPETLKVLKSLFTTDILDIFKTVTDDILAGKQINTLLGISSLGKGPRIAAQKLQQPCRLSYAELQKRGVLSPQRYKKLQESYMEFINSLSDEVFKTNNPIPEGLENEANEEEGGQK